MSNRATYMRLGFISLAFLLGVGVVWVLFVQADSVAAAADTSTLVSTNLTWNTNQSGPTAQPADDSACRICHGDSTSTVEFPSGESLSVQINIDELDHSAHGIHSDTDLACTSCHAPTQYQYPHQPIEVTDLRSYQLTQALTCERCHQAAHITSHPDAESDTPVACTDCHTAHNVQVKEAWHEGEGLDTCVNCHSANNVPTVNRSELAEVIQNGLFTNTAPTNEYCSSCHSLENLSLTLANGDVLDLTVTADTLAHSVHGNNNEWQPLACIDCHKDYRYPHEAVTATTARGYSLEKYPVCGECHQPKYEQAQDSVHARALEEGKLEAAVCTDCHGAHDIPVPNEPRERISLTCRKCHSTIYDEYAQSVHGNALLAGGNADVPTCIECHGVHNINDPTTNLFRVRSPQLCASCHANEELMTKYDISTDVFNTYVADFHGTTVTLFEQEDPNAETNKAVCYDCHGVHNIKKPDDPEAGIKNNLLTTCQQCHPNATEGFPDSWTSHFQPSLEHNPLVYLINGFYSIVIPATVGFFGFLVLTDIYRRLFLRR